MLNQNLTKGYLCLVLHAHLPFVRHPEKEYFLEENWLYEAITETYIPLIQVFEKLIQDKVKFRLTMSLTPPLISMLQDELLQTRYLRHINRLIELSEKEMIRTAFDPPYRELAVMYNQKFKACKEIFEKKYNRDIIQAFKGFQEQGFLEIITCAATHGFLPILNIQEKIAKAQVQIGADFYRKTFDCNPKGIWLAECGYVPGVDKFIAEEKINYFFVDSHGILHADPSPRYGVYAPIFCPSGVAAFGRDSECSKQVWSAKEGYPGDSDYREYYRDIGFELDQEYLKPYIDPSGLRVNTGMKYNRITGNTEYKEVYRPDRALEKAAFHAEDFILTRKKQVEYLSPLMDRRPIIIAPYDAELYGHWWYEGPQFIDFLVRKIYYDQDAIELITPTDYLQEYTMNQLSLPSCSSWGYKGYSEFWLDKSNSWIYRHIHKAGERMLELSDKFRDKINISRKDIVKEALEQAARELLLAQASDWPFIIKAGTMVEYANKRITTHIGRFTKIYDDILQNRIDEFWLKEVARRDNIFSDINCAKYYLKEI